MQSSTLSSSRKWLLMNPSRVERYLWRNHHYYDRDDIRIMLFKYPDEAVKLIKNYALSNEEKILDICKFIIKSDQLTVIIYGDQRMGKDVTACYFIMKCLELLEMNFIRVVTLGNIKRPPFVRVDSVVNDMYYSYTNIPPGFGHDFVIVYCSELEIQFPAREGSSAENKIFSILEGTAAQNHHKIIGCVKLASKVDINVIRSCNMKMFKFISPDKLNVENIERDGILSGLGRLLIPKDRNDKSQVLVSFDNNLYTIKVGLPTWWTQEYSEMYKNIPMDKINEFIEFAHDNEYTIDKIVTAVKQKFRKTVNKEYVKNLLKL